MDFKQKKDLRLAKRPERKLSQSLISKIQLNTENSSSLKKSFLISMNNSRVSLNNSVDNF
jgi:hypothetical protein